MFITAIFDRTEQDVQKVREYREIGYRNLTDEQKKEWDDGLKGAWNCKDINRLENNIQFLADLFKIDGLNTKTDWNYTDIASVQDIQRIVDNLNKLRDNVRIRGDTPQTPTLPINTYQKINDLEKILYDMYYIVENETTAFARNSENFGAELYCGDAIAVI